MGEEAQRAFVQTFGALLRLRNILTAFDAFAQDDPIPARDLQDWQSAYIDLWQARRKNAKADKEDVRDDLVFEMELVRQEELGLDAILALVDKLRAAHGADRQTNAEAIVRAVGASPRLRSKRALIEAFIQSLNARTPTGEAWRTFVRARYQSDLDALIAAEGLRPEATRAFMDNALRDDRLRTTGTDLDALLPPLSLFTAGSPRAAKSEAVIGRLAGLFERFRGLGL